MYGWLLLYAYPEERVRQGGGGSKDIHHILKDP